MTMEGFARAMLRAITTTSASSESVAGVVHVTTMAIIARKVSSLFGTAFAQPDTSTIVISVDRLTVPTQLDILTRRPSV
jgi:hypothetical protein